MNFDNYQCINASGRNYVSFLNQNELKQWGSGVATSRTLTDKVLTSWSSHLSTFNLTCVSEEVAVVRGDHPGAGVIEAIPAVKALGWNDQRRVAVG